jgi:hypothetical protein
MFIEPTVISVLIAKFKGGSFKNIGNVNIKGWYLFIIAGLIQVSLSILKKIDTYWSNYIITEYFLHIITITYFLMTLTILMNINKSYMKLFLIGVVLNFIVIFGNGGKMPVSLNGIEGIHKEVELPNREYDIKHVAVNKDTKFIYLADIILIPKPYPLPKILSVGDIFLMLGCFVFFQEELNQ